MKRIRTCFGVPNSCCSLAFWPFVFNWENGLSREGGREGKGQKLVRPLGKEKYIGRIKTPETRFIMAALLLSLSTPLIPIFFRGKEEKRVEWDGEHQHHMLLRRLLQLQHNDGYLIDNLPHPRESSPNGNFAAFACVTVHLPRGGGRGRRSFHSASQTERWENNGAGGEMKVGEYGSRS